MRDELKAICASLEELSGDLDDKLNQMKSLLDNEQVERPVLIPLKEHDARIRMNAYHKSLRTGIACPDCGGELEDVDNVVMPSFPSQIKCRCTECKWEGTRLC